MLFSCIFEKNVVTLQPQSLCTVKRLLYILGVLLTSLILVGAMVVAALMSDKVQTAAVHLATTELSRALGTQAQVGSVEYKFPARVALHDVYLEDQQKDTLAYIGVLYAHFKPAALRQNEIVFSHVHVQDAVGKIYKVDDKWNFQFLLDSLRSDEQKAPEPLKSLIAVRDIQLDNMRLQMEDYTLALSHAQMDLNHLTDDEIDAQISELKAQVTRAQEPEPFIVEDLAARVIFNDTILSLPMLKARLPQSSVDMSGIDVHFPPGDTLYLSKSAHDITFALDIHQAELTPSDISFFVPKTKNLTQPVSLTGSLSGRLDSLAFEQINLSYNGRTVLEGDISAVGLPDLSNPYVRANLTEVQTTAARLQDFLSHLQGKPVHLPKQLFRLGTVHYRGTVEGKLHDLTVHGAFRTALGSISTDGTVRSDSSFAHMDYNARVVGRKLQLGRLLGHTPLGAATIDIQSNGAIDDGKVRGDVKAHVHNLTYNNYTYEDLHLNGRIEPKRYNGRFDINDPHLSMAFDGVVDLHDVNPEINFNLRCRHFDSAPLGIAALGNGLTTRFKMAVDMDGVELDRISGYMVIDSLFLATPRDSILMRQMQLFASANANSNKAITLRSDYLTAQMDGTFRYGDILPAMQHLLHHYLPTAIDEPKRTWHPVSVSMRADGKRLRDIQRLFVAPITLSDHPTMRAEAKIDAEHEPQLSMRFFAPGVRASNTPVHDLTIDLSTVDSLRHRGAKGSGLSLAISAEAMKMHTIFSTLAFHDTLLTQVTLRREADIDAALPEGWRSLTPRALQHALWSNTSLSGRERYQALLAAQRAGNYGGDIQLITHFSRYNQRPLIDLHIMPGTLILRDSLYTIDDSRISYCAADTAIQVDHFSFKGGGQHLLAHGVASRRKSDTLSVDLQKIDASYVVPFVLPVQTIMFNGLLTGKAQIASVLRQPHIETKIHVDSMGLNNCYFGEADVDLHIKDSLAFHADVMRPTRKVVNLDGKALFDGSGVWELNMDADSVPLAFINHWTETVLRDLDGYGTGKVIVGGRKGMVYVLLRCAAEDASLTLPWTGARYTIAHDTIVMDTTAILFPNVHLTDAEGNKVEVNGGVYHDQFRDFALDIHVDAHDALVFDSEKKGEMLQGRVYASGHVDVTGDERDILVAADAVTSHNSRFRLSVDNVANAYESNFIHFVQHLDSLPLDTLQPGETDLDNIDIKVETHADSSLFVRAGRALLKLNIEVNPQLLFQLVLGERNGDVIQARGNGALSLAYDTETGDVHLLGTYDIDQGTLSYTVANVIRKEFTIGEGSTIVFSGDATNPQLDVTAKHRVVANLRDLFGDDADQIATSRSNIPVLTCLHLSGLLSSPVLSFSLEFPQSDQTIQQQIRQVINTDEMLMRQVIYLLVFGRFFTPDYMGVAQFATLNSTYSLLSSTVTSQINAWLSKLTNMLTLGVAIRTEGEGAGSSQEYEAQFQLQPVDRLVINGNVGYRYNDISNQPFFGDLDVEVLLTEDGQLRMKGYTHMVDKYSLRQASTIQGFGFLWKKDFNWPERKKKKEKSEK